MDFSRYSLEGRVAIVTGGSGGIGSASARAFADAGANVVIVSVPADSIPPVVADIETRGVEALGIAANVANADEVEKMVAQTMERFGRIDILMNVAGGTFARNPDMPQYNRGALLEMSEHDFMTTFESNVKTGFLCAKAVVPHMKAAGSGVIINIGSSSGMPNPGGRTGDLTAYGAAKAAVHQMTLRMAQQWGPEIRAVCIAPGIIQTPRPAGYVRPEMADAAERIAVGRLGVADDIAGVAGFLASDAASFVNGVTIVVNGGE
jgi:NAD(P)-dependent dehydrogenase (short-subunit alcohol dehydrogenase family)